jgi:ABC-type antimicrobial peptide transport system permease subunit
MIESICLAVIGGLFGVLLTLPLNGFTTGVGSFATFAETAFKFKINAFAIGGGLLFAAVIGALGGFMPAWAAARKGIIAAMRDV